MNRIVTSLLVCATFAVAPLASSATPITVPTGLNPGDQYRLAFVTSTTRDGSSANIADYNDFVTTAANSVPELAALGTTWKAIGSTATVDARDNTGTNPASTGVPIYRLDDIRVANNNADLWDSSIQVPISLDELGTYQWQTVVWTGSHWTGIKINQVELGSAGPYTGRSNGADTGWITYNNLAQTYLFHLYGMSAPLTVPVPEPSMLALGLAGLAGLIAFPWLRRRSR